MEDRKDGWGRLTQMASIHSSKPFCVHCLSTLKVIQLIILYYNVPKRKAMIYNSIIQNNTSGGIILLILRYNEEIMKNRKQMFN
jgi:hypothetical protein